MSARPRLADHALLRRHLVDGAERFFIHHGHSGSLVAIDERGYQLLALADGTRDLEGVALGARRAGLAGCGADELQPFFAALEQADLLADDSSNASAPAGEALADPPPAGPPLAHRPIATLPGYRFHCDGSGGCCSQYASIAFSAAEVRAARRAGLRTLASDLEGERVFLPLHGSLPGERFAVTLVDGACCQLDENRRCALQLAGGPDAKPVGCRMYPATFADDGESLRVSVALECECVVQSLLAGGAGASGLVDQAARQASDLPAGLRVRLVPDPVLIAGAHAAPRREIVGWVDEVLDNSSLEPALRVCLTLARALEGGSLARPGSLAIAQDRCSAAELAAELRPAVELIAIQMRRAAEAADAWRSARDRTRRLRHALAAASAALLARGLQPTLEAAPAHAASDPPWASVEAFALRAALFGHQLLDERPFADGLRELAARLLIARELALAGRSELGHPIACVMAALRGAG